MGVGIPLRWTAHLFACQALPSKLPPMTPLKLNMRLGRGGKTKLSGEVFCLFFFDWKKMAEKKNLGLIGLLEKEGYGSR